MNTETGNTTVMTDHPSSIAPRPNILLVMMDDMGYGDMGCFGSTSVATPVMDRIAQIGVKATQMYSAAPICTPSRAALLTGRYAQKVGLPRVLFPDDLAGLTVGVPAHRTVAAVLRDTGYRTACFGKWHLGCLDHHLPTRHGFDTFFGLPYSNDMDPLNLYRNETVIETNPDQAYLTERYTDEVMEFIGRSGPKPGQEPWFAYLAHTMPHIPLHVPQDFRGRSKGGIYGDAIECIDHHLGVLLAFLEERGELANTLVMVTSDNGPWFEGSTGGLRGRKFECYEGGVRMPFVAQWPMGIAPHTTCSEVTSFLDVLPTVTALAGGVLPAGTDGHNMLATLRGDAPSPHVALYYYVIDTAHAIRCGKWKLHITAGMGDRRVTKEMPQLFDMEVDPGENYNLARNHPEVVADLAERLHAFDASVQPVPNTIRGSVPLYEHLPSGWT